MSCILVCLAASRYEAMEMDFDVIKSIEKSRRDCGFFCRNRAFAAVDFHLRLGATIEAVTD
jgi:hypothetical protein